MITLENRYRRFQNFFQIEKIPSGTPQNCLPEKSSKSPCKIVRAGSPPLPMIPKLNCDGIPLPILCSGVSYETKLLGAAFLSTARHLHRAQGRFTMPFMPYMRFEENASFWLLPHLSGYCLNGVELEKLTILANYYFKIPKFSPAAPQSSEDVRTKILR